MDPAEAERIARELFGVAGRASPLPGERDDNFRLDTAATRYVLKLHAPDTDPAELEFQDAAIAHAGTPLLAGRTTRAGERFARLLSWVEGTPWAEAGPWEPALLRELGRTVARVDRALARVDHPSKMRPHRWNMLDAPQLSASTPSGFVADALHSFHELRPSLDELPWQVIHNDANDHNVIVAAGRRSVSVIDFGDIVWAPRVCGLAVACAYAMLGQPQPVRAILPLVAGYHEEQPLAPAELAPLYDLIRTRLAMSVLNAVDQLAEAPENDYLAISQEPIRDLVDRLEHESAELAHLRFRDACGYRAVPTEHAVVSHVRLAPSPDVIRLDDGRPGGYLEPRGWYGGEAFATDDPGERRTVHLGVDVWHPAGEPVFAAHDGVVEAVEVRPHQFDFGGVVILRHATADGVPFFTLYGHLAHALPRAGDGGRAERADRRARQRARERRLGAAPALPAADDAGRDGNRRARRGGAVRARRMGVDLPRPEPDPAGAGLRAPARARSREHPPPPPDEPVRGAVDLVPGTARDRPRRARVPVRRGRQRLARPRQQRLPRRARATRASPAALAEQAAVLNTNTRYLHPTLVTYARRLAATLPDPLSRRVPDELRLRGERPRAADRARPHRPRATCSRWSGATTATSRR